MGRNLSSAISIRINAGLDKFRPIGNLAGYEGMEPKHRLNSGFEARGGWTEGGVKDEAVYRSSLRDGYLYLPPLRWFPPIDPRYLSRHHDHRGCRCTWRPAPLTVVSRTASRAPNRHSDLRRLR